MLLNHGSSVVSPHKVGKSYLDTLLSILCSDNTQYSYSLSLCQFMKSFTFPAVSPPPLPGRSFLRRNILTTITETTVSDLIWLRFGFWNIFLKPKDKKNVLYPLVEKLWLAGPTREVMLLDVKGLAVAASVTGGCQSKPEYRDLKKKLTQYDSPVSQICNGCIFNYCWYKEK